MPLALWVLVFTMTVAVYTASLYQDPYRHQPKIKIPSLVQIRPAPQLWPETAGTETGTVPGSAKPVASVSKAVLVASGDAKSVASVASDQRPPSITQQQSQIKYITKSELLYHPIILQAADRYQVDPAIVKAIIMAESSFNPRAVSKKGAKGLMQLMPETAEEMGVKDIFNPEHNINGGVRYYKKLLQRFKGDVKLALAAYNAGLKKVKEHKGVPPFKSTRYYIKKVFEYYRYYKNQLETDQV